VSGANAYAPEENARSAKRKGCFLTETTDTSAPLTGSLLMGVDLPRKVRPGGDPEPVPELDFDQTRGA
jgi:hypothetical protein